MTLITQLPPPHTPYFTHTLPPSLPAPRRCRAGALCLLCHRPGQRQGALHGHRRGRRCGSRRRRVDHPGQRQAERGLCRHVVRCAPSQQRHRRPRRGPAAARLRRQGRQRGAGGWRGLPARHPGACGQGCGHPAVRCQAGRQRARTTPPHPTWHDTPTPAPLASPSRPLCVQATYDNLANQGSWGAEASRDLALSAMPSVLAGYHQGDAANTFLSARLAATSIQVGAAACHCLPLPPGILAPATVMQQLPAAAGLFFAAAWQQLVVRLPQLCATHSPHSPHSQGSNPPPRPHSPAAGHAQRQPEADRPHLRPAVV
jgi:hypothetical protein